MPHTGTQKRHGGAHQAARPARRKSLKTWQKATALVPLALLSGAWTASLTVTGTASATAATGHDGDGTHRGSRLPDGSSVPDQAIKAPASVTTPGEIAPGVPEGAAQSVISSASTSGIPAAALTAYQQAAQVINAADPSCHLPWELIAAIGRVESDHGRYGGNTLTAAGFSKPGIYGIPLDGSNGTAKVTDTDAGQYDHDQVYDRAVGPMQFIPSTWSVVGVDGDGDGKRDPQDINDAALATAVYLCSGKENLATTGGQERAVYRYNHSQDYVDLVMSLMRAYMNGDYSAVPTAAAAAPVLAPLAPGSVPSLGHAGHKAHHAKKKHRHHKRRHRAQQHTGGSGGSSTGSGSGGSNPLTGSTSGGSDPVQKVTDTAKNTVKQTTDQTKDTVKKTTDNVTKTTQDTKTTVKDTLTPLEQATKTCQSSFSSAQLAKLGGLSACAQKLVNGATVSSLRSDLTQLLNDTTDTVGGAVDGVTGGLTGN